MSHFIITIRKYPEWFPCYIPTVHKTLVNVYLSGILRNKVTAATAAAKSLQSCPTLWDPTDGSPPGSPVPGILQARVLEWVAVSFSNAWKWKVKVKSLSHVWLFTTPWTAAYQAPLPMGLSRQEYRSGLPLPSPKVTAQTSKLRFLKCNLSHLDSQLSYL